jgi:hypothetical protein
MNLRHLVLVGTSLVPLLLGCSDSETVLSVNINVSSDKLYRRADMWQPIQVTINGGGKVVNATIALQTSQQDVPSLGPDNRVLMEPNPDNPGSMRVANMRTAALIPRFFQRVDLPAGFPSSAIVTATASGAYLANAGMDRIATPTTFVSGSAEQDLADADMQKFTIGVTQTPTPIEEEGVSAVFLEFMAPEAEPLPAGGSGGAGSGTGGAASGSGGAAAGSGGTATATGGTSTGGSKSSAGAGGLAAGAGGQSSGGGGTGGGAASDTAGTGGA